MIDYLLIGHVSTDLTPDGPKPGGAVTFATSFFLRLHRTRDPWDAARFANLLAARSVTQPDPASKMREIRRVVNELS